MGEGCSSVSTDAKLVHSSQMQNENKYALFIECHTIVISYYCHVILQNYDRMGH